MEDPSILGITSKQSREENGIPEIFEVFHKTASHFKFDDNQEKQQTWNMNFYTRPAIMYNKACEKTDADVKMTKTEMLTKIE